MEPDLVLDEGVSNHLVVVRFTDVHARISVFGKCVVHKSIVIRELKQPEPIDRMIANHVPYEPVA